MAGSLWIAVVQGLVEGITEFLPVSSTGHLILVGQWLRFSDEKAHAFEIFIQFGAILAVVWDFRRPLVSMMVRARGEAAPRRFLLAVLAAFVPAALAGLALHRTIEERLYFPGPIAGAFIVGGFLILLVEAWVSTRSRPSPSSIPQTIPSHASSVGRVGSPIPTVSESVESITWGQAIGVGFAQIVSLFPGFSRSAATILGGLVCGMSRRVATEFSFYLAIPTLAAASGYSLLKELPHLSLSDAPVFAAGFVVSFLAAAVVVRGFLAYVRARTLVPFAWYRILIGALILGLVTTGHWAS